MIKRTVLFGYYRTGTIQKFLCTPFSKKHTSPPSPENSAPQIINENISFRPAFNSNLCDNERPLVLLYGWLVAKSKHIYKYGDFYLGKGFDVVHVKVQPTQVLRPSQAKAVAEKVLSFVDEPERQHQPILYHGFSVGGYLYGETLVKINSFPHLYQQIGNRIKGQVFDSPVDFAGIPYGFPQAVTNNKYLQNTMRILIEVYLKLLHNQTTKHYMKASKAFKDNKLRVPSIYMYSEQDVVADHKIIEEAIQIFKDNNIEVYSEVFEESYHVGHFHKDPVRYIGALNDFLQRIGLVPVEVTNSECRSDIKVNKEAAN